MIAAREEIELKHVQNINIKGIKGMTKVHRATVAARES